MIRSANSNTTSDDQPLVQSANTKTALKRRSRSSRDVKFVDDPSVDERGEGVSADTGTITTLNFHYLEEWKENFAKDCLFWRFDVTHLLQRNLLMGFLERLKQVQLLDFFQETCEVIVPRDLIVNFILESRIERDNTTRVLTYELERGKLRNLQVKITRKSFAEALCLPVVEREDELKEYSNPKFFRGTAVEWLGSEYFGVLCKCRQMHISSSGFADCTQCSSQNSPEAYWLSDEIKDSSIKDLIHFIGVWIHNTASTSCLRRAAISSVLEALDLQSAKQIWTQHLWTNFLWTIEKLKEAGSHNIPCECSYSTAGVISAVLSGQCKKLKSWNQAWKVWEQESYTPGMRTCKEMIKRVNMSSGSAAESIAEEAKEALMFTRGDV